MENKASKFKRLASARTGKILDMIDLLGNLSNSSFYEYTDEEVEKIFNEIAKALEENKAKFSKKRQKGNRFSL